MGLDLLSYTSFFEMNSFMSLICLCGFSEILQEYWHDVLEQKLNRAFSKQEGVSKIMIFSVRVPRNSDFSLCGLPYLSLVKIAKKLYLFFLNNISAIRHL